MIVACLLSSSTCAILVCARGCFGPIVRSRASHGIVSRSPFDSQMDLLMCFTYSRGDFVV